MKRHSPLEATPPPSKISKRIDFFSKANSSFSGPKPFTDMMATWKRIIAEEEAIPPAQVMLHSHPLTPTTSSEAVVFGPRGGVEKADIRWKEDSPLPSTPDFQTNFFFPYDKCGETWDQCVAEAEEEIRALQKKWDDEDEIRALPLL